jgi:hypothetical protein
MLTQSRETVLNALLNLLKNVTFSAGVSGKTSFVTTSRRVRHWSDVPKSARPALFMACHAEQPTYRNEHTVAYNKLSVKLFVYLDTSDRAFTPDTDVSVVLDAIDVALAPSPGPQVQTLGGLVSHCRVEGEVLRDPGDLDGDGIIIIPISINLT